MSDAIDRAAEAKVRELEHAIEHAARALYAHRQSVGDFPDGLTDWGDLPESWRDEWREAGEHVVRALADSGLLAPASLREEWTVIYVDPPYGTSIPMDELHARSLATRNDTLTRRYVTDPEVVR